jgi:hypothetical protein
MQNYFELVQGDDYLASIGRAIKFNADGACWPIGAPATVTLRITNLCGQAVEIAGAYVAQTLTTAAVVTFDVTRIQTAALATGVRGHMFSVVGDYAGAAVTLVSGAVTVFPRV